MRYCDTCDIEHTNVHCPRCGTSNRVQPEGTWHSTFVSDPPSSVADVTDEQVEQASRPSLATLVKAGLKKGYIHIVPDYTQFKAKKKN